MAAKKKAAKKAAKKKSPDKTTAGRRVTTAAEKPTVTLPVPSLGRIVMFGGGDAPSIIPMPGMVVKQSADPRGNISIMVLHEAGSSRALDVPYSKEPKAGAWWWPPRVADVEVPVDE